MSGGHFDYNQYVITQIIDQIQFELDKQGKPNPNFDSRYDTEPNYPFYSEAVQEQMRSAIISLTEAHVKTHRLYRFLSGDDSENTYLKRLNEDLEANEQVNQLAEFHRKGLFL